MKLELHELYHYVFGDWADINKHINANLSETIKKQKIAKKAQEIRDFFNDLKLDYTKAIPFLQSINNTHLIKLLGDYKTQEKDKITCLHDEKVALEKIKLCEVQIGFCSDEKSEIPRDIFNLFYTYYKVSKFVVECIEKNGDDNDNLAFRHAYILLVVFGRNASTPFKYIDTYLKQFNFNSHDKPLHDALLYGLPDLKGKKIHLEKWRDLIYKSGEKAVRLFIIASAIEEKLNNQFPDDLQHAITIAKEVRYKRIKENPALVDLFIKYFIPEEGFNLALETEKKKKQKDNLPNITICGADIDDKYDGYYLTKLPIDDLNAYVLGELTNCCQSIGGATEECVIDGITKENNGFYVLLKAKEENASPFLLGGKINYASFDIVGQGYAWLSKDNNLVFDSWENLTPSRDDKIIAILLKRFSKKVVRDYSCITCVSIGTGGKTPKEMTKELAYFSEVIKEGLQCTDSREQAIIESNDKKRYKMVSDFTSFLKPYTDEKIDHNTVLKLLNEGRATIFCDDLKKLVISLKQKNALLSDSIKKQNEELLQGYYNARLGLEKLIPDLKCFGLDHNQSLLKFFNEHNWVEVESYYFQKQSFWATAIMRREESSFNLRQILKIVTATQHLTQKEQDLLQPYLFVHANRKQHTEKQSEAALNLTITRFLNAFDLLKTNSLDTNLHLCKKLLARYDPEESVKNYLYALSLLKKNHLDNDNDILNSIIIELYCLKNDDINHTSTLRATNTITIIDLFKKHNLDVKDQIIHKILSVAAIIKQSEITAFIESLDKAILLLKNDKNLPRDYLVVAIGKVLHHKSSPEAMANKIITILATLKKANVEIGLGFKKAVFEYYWDERNDQLNAETICKNREAFFNFISKQSFWTAEDRKFYEFLFSIVLWEYSPETVIDPGFLKFIEAMKNLKIQFENELKQSNLAELEKKMETWSYGENQVEYMLAFYKKNLKPLEEKASPISFFSQPNKTTYDEKNAPPKCNLRNFFY